MAPDEHEQIQLSMDYDGKRDRWNGYDPDEHMRNVEEYAKVDLVSHVVGYFCVFMFILLHSLLMHTQLSFILSKDHFCHDHYHTFVILSYILLEGSFTV